MSDQENQNQGTPENPTVEENDNPTPEENEDNEPVNSGEPQTEISGDGGRDIDIRERIKERVALGGATFTFTEDEMLAVIDELGIERDELPNIGRQFEGGEGSPMAGLTPATGSGGTPVDTDAASDATKEAANDAQSRLDEDDYPDGFEGQRQRANDRRIAGSVDTSSSPDAA